MKQSLQQAIEDKELPDADYPEFEPGDKIRVTTTQEIQGQQRKRHFEGVCIARRGEGPDKTFKVRKVSFGVGVERIYPLYSPIIDDIEIVKKGKVRRAKLSYLEGRSAKDSRIEEERVDLEELNRTGAEAAPAEDDVEPEDAPESGDATADETADDVEEVEPADEASDETRDSTESQEEQNADTNEVEEGEQSAETGEDQDDASTEEDDEQDAG